MWTDATAGPAPESVIHVKDSGPGIPTELRATLFHPFTSRRPGGTGLGLAIAHRIVTAHHGALTFTTSGDTGTTFRISLPRRVAP